MLADLERSGEDQISLTDPDSRAMAAYTKVGVGYNIQIAVDAKNKMIVEQAVSNQVVDMGLLTQTAEAARDILEVEQIDVVADKGYFKIEDIEACEKAGMTPYVPRPQRGSAVREGFFRKDEFRYDAERDAYICPGGQILATRYESKLRDLKKFDYCNRDGVSRLPAQIALHDRLAQGLTSGKRGGAGPHGGAADGADPRYSIRAAKSSSILSAASNNG